MTVITEEGGFIGTKPDWIGKRNGVWSLQDQYQLKKVDGWPIPIGTEFGGGFYAGAITYDTYDYQGNLQVFDGWIHGPNPPSYHIIVAPKSLGESTSTLQFKTSNTADNTTAEWDGYYNTYTVFGSSSVHPAHAYCRNLTINGYSDWYLPATFEQGRAFRNLQDLPKWQSGGTEAFNLTGATHFNQGVYWSSSQSGTAGANGWMASLNNNTGGTVFGFNKTDYSWVRAVRRIPYPS